jgi:hypothetical protein
MPEWIPDPAPDKGYADTTNYPPPPTLETEPARPLKRLNPILMDCLIGIRPTTHYPARLWLTNA